ncbi:hypothetical protein ACFXGA_08220 [Actinosynnema sp. NPDC059335]|uniref:hypothetical protein n=1 Tax=Actinosynnema sp. NPDC059335 TaxID=3346804 RepID=UPI00366F7EB4
MYEAAVVFGLCALSFAAGCVLTAVMLRRDQPPPEPVPEPAPAPREPEFAAPFPPEEYVTRPIHRNPVLGMPTALAPAPAPTRPTLVLVPTPRPEAGDRVPQDEVRRMRVVRLTAEAGETDPAGAEPVEARPTGKAEPAEPEPTAEAVPASAEPAKPVPVAEPVAAAEDPAGPEDTADPARPAPDPGTLPRTAGAARRDTGR